MKIFITEEQHKRLKESIYDFFNSNLTPYEGWKRFDEYKNEIRFNGGELFILLNDEEEGDLDGQNHMWYSECENDNLSEPLDEGHCPVINLPRPTYDALNGYFGPKWKELFRRWFKSHTDLDVIEIDKV